MVAGRLKSLFGLPSAADNWEDRRSEPRNKVLLKGDIFPVEGYVELVVNNVSRTGLAGETDAPLEADGHLLFSLEANRFHLAVVRWVKGRRFGADMTDALAVLGLEDETDTGFRPTHQPRARRHDVELYGRVAIAPRVARATIRDVSRSGLCIEGPLQLPERQQVLVRLRDRPLIMASVQWSGGGKLGVKTAERMETLRLVYAYE
jgi:hypothetical protein